MGYSQYKEGYDKSCRIIAQNVIFALCAILRFNERMSAENTFLKTIRSYALVPTGSLLVVAVSGGADSLALLHLLHAYQQTLKCRLHVATLDHRLRGDAGAADAQYVADLAREWGVPATVGETDVPALACQQGLGIEAAARLARYDFLAEVARDSGADRIAVAHHADDQVETVLMRLLRGTGVDGLAGMSYSAPLPGHSDLTLIRPLLDVTRDSIEAYCREHDLKPRHDLTNEDTRYTRNHLRREVLPYLEKHYPQVKRSLVQLASVAAVENDFVEGQLTQQLLPEIEQANDRIFLNRQRFRDVHPALQRRYVRWAAVQFGATDDLAYTHVVAAVDVMLHGEQGALAELPGGVQFRVDYDTIVAERATAPPLLPEDCFLMKDGGEILVQIPGVTPLPEGWELHAQAADAQVESRVQSGACLALKLGDHVILRTRREGDRITVQTGDGRTHTRKVNRWMIDSKIPQAARPFVPLLVVNGEIAAILWGRRWKVASSFTPSNPFLTQLCMALVNRNK
jgi:tRNA(Ile)-lysidine synthase